MEISQSDKAKKLLIEQRYKEALAIYRTFRVGFDKEQKRTIEIAYESLCGKASFYHSLGIDTEQEVSKAIKLLTSKYQI